MTTDSGHNFRAPNMRRRAGMFSKSTTFNPTSKSFVHRQGQSHLSASLPFCRHSSRLPAPRAVRKISEVRDRDAFWIPLKPCAGFEPIEDTAANTGQLRLTLLLQGGKRTNQTPNPIHCLIPHCWPRAYRAHNAKCPDRIGSDGGACRHPFPTVRRQGALIRSTTASARLRQANHQAPSRRITGRNQKLPTQGQLLCYMIMYY